MKLAFYAYFYGSADNKAFRIPELPSEKYNCYYFTNNIKMLEKLQETKWIGVLDDRSINDDVYESNMIGKYIKSCPHKFKELQDYDYVCYLDNKLGQANIPLIEEYINKYFIEQDYAIMLRQHWYIFSNNVWDEYAEAIKQERYRLQSDNYTKYINEQIAKGLSEITKNHCATGVILRNMKHAKINELNETWYQHIQECGIQCQISFFFVKQLFADCIHIYDDSLITSDWDEWMAGRWLEWLANHPD